MIRKSLLVLFITLLTGATSLPTSAWAMGSADDASNGSSTRKAPNYMITEMPGMRWAYRILYEMDKPPSIPHTALATVAALSDEASFDSPHMFDEMLSSTTFDPAQISSLKLTFTPTQEQFSLIANLPNLRTLTLFDMSSNKRPMEETFLTALTQKPLLDTISLHYYKLTEASFAALTQNPHLRNIHLDCCGGLTEAAAIALAEKPGLNSLHLPGPLEITDAFYTAAAQNPSLCSVEPSKLWSRFHKLQASLSADYQAAFDRRMRDRNLTVKFIY